MVVADKEGLSPKNYRKFNIRYDLKNNNISKIDDYYMMEEVLTRRLSKIDKKDESPIPDVIIIDGGRGQFNSVLKILKKYQLENINLLSVSKGT
jgi:excinuclease ABC subunit C